MFLSVPTRTSKWHSRGRQPIYILKKIKRLPFFGGRFIFGDTFYQKVLLGINLNNYESFLRCFRVGSDARFCEFYPFSVVACVFGDCVALICTRVFAASREILCVSVPVRSLKYGDIGVKFPDRFWTESISMWGFRG